MILQKLSILNYKNIKAAELSLSPGMNCFIGSNGAGKTNVIDAVYYLSFCRSALCAVDSQVMRHGEAFSCSKAVTRQTAATLFRFTVA